jgi:hypothetical protein
MRIGPDYIRKYLAALRVILAKREAVYQKAVDQAVTFTKHALSRDEDYDPGMISSRPPPGGRIFRSRRSYVSSVAKFAMTTPAISFITEKTASRSLIPARNRHGGIVFLLNSRACCQTEAGASW